ncbi:nuclear transport factor 2 family protein [Actinomyces capricornis]|uniref:ABM domain-containing protein n=1 Tax=Actinomyces capricornis TaxID=2755559 RepID=A0ABN6K2I9_9ACTO|nr:nuclear transport factor 2 family protein [Actinomyces capricornis]BDA63829.1 hypothetical protein MANAM107_06630 [Actinomyces capricornis]
MTSAATTSASTFAAPLEILEALFEAENARDWEALAACLHPEVEWRIGTQVVRGPQAYVDRLRQFYAGAKDSASRFRLHQAIASEDEATVVVLLVSGAGDRSLEVFEVTGGLVRREWEFELGAGTDWNGAALQPTLDSPAPERVVLSGRLICAEQDQAEAVSRLLPEHIAASLAEPGCLSFDVHPTDDPLIWEVHEVFADAAAFRSHQERAATSEWGTVTHGVERRYEICGALRGPSAPQPTRGPASHTPMGSFPPLRPVMQPTGGGALRASAC